MAKAISSTIRIKDLSLASPWICREDDVQFLLNPTHGHEDDALDHSTSCPSMKWVRTSRCDARSSTRCCREGCSKSSASGNRGWHLGRYWRPLNALCRCSTTSQNTYLSSNKRRKSSPKNCRYDDSKIYNTIKYKIGNLNDTLRQPSLFRECIQTCNNSTNDVDDMAGAHIIMGVITPKNF